MSESTADLSDGTRRYYTLHLRTVVQGIGPDVELDEITRKDVEAHYQRRLVSVAGATVAKESQALRRLLKVMAAHDLFHHNLDAVAPRFRHRYVPRDRWLTEEECAALLGQLLPRWRLWVQLAVYTGGRRSEIDRLEWGHIDMRRGTVALPGTKTGGSNRLVPLADPLRKALSDRQVGGVIVGEWCSLYRDLSGACKRAGIKRVTPNDMRRTFASWMLQRGAAPFVVARLLGHTDLAMVMRVYGQLGDRDLRAAVDTLPGVGPRLTLVEEP